MNKPDDGNSTENTPDKKQYDIKKSEQTSKNTRSNLIIFVSVSAVVVMALVTVIIVLLNRTPETKERIVVEQKQSGKGTVITQENLDEAIATPSSSMQDAFYIVTMNNSWTFDTAQTPSRNAYVKNTEDNSRTVFFDVTLSDTSEAVYTSPYIPVGSELRSFALDTDLDTGEYNAIVTYYLVDDDYNVLTNVSVSVLLIVNA